MIPFNNSFNSTSISVSAWIKRTSNGTSSSLQALTIMGRYEYGYNNPNGESWVLDILHGASSSGPIIRGSIIKQSPSPALSISSASNTQAILNEWTFVSMTYDGNLLCLYKNGQLISSAFSNNMPVNNVGNSGISIGLSRQANGHWSPYDGVIDDISLYNRALTQSEITSLYNSNSCIANITNNDTSICRGSSITLNAAAVNAASVTDINGNVYTSVNIGTQTWMQKNLNVSKYKNGDIIPQVTNATQWAALTTLSGVEEMPHKKCPDT